MKFSIITATKNNKEGLLRAIECVRNQSYKNVEHIIIDGGSTDGSVEVLRQVQDDLRSAQNDNKSTVILNEMKDLHSDRDSSSSTQNDIRIVDSGSESGMTGRNYQLLAISEPDTSIYDAINKGIKLTSGDVIGLLHSDDLYADEKVLEKYAEVFKLRAERKEQSEVEAVYSDLLYVRKKSDVKRLKREVRSQELEAGIEKTTNYSLLTTNYSVIRYWKAHKTVISNQSSVNSKNTDHHLLVTDHLLKKGWMPPHPTLFIRKEVFNKYGLYNTDLKIASDYEMILRLLLKYKITSYYLPITTYLMSIGGVSNKSLKNIIQKSKEDYSAMKMNGINFPVLTLISKNLRKLPQFLARDLS